MFILPRKTCAKQRLAFHHSLRYAKESRKSQDARRGGFVTTFGTQQTVLSLEDWIPERMDPGTMFPFAAPHQNPDRPHSPFVGVFSCPEKKCGLIGLITRDQFMGRSYMICGSDTCSAEYRFKEHLDGENRIEFRKSM
jgi:hypothetical protein